MEDNLTLRSDPKGSVSSRGVASALGWDIVSVRPTLRDGATRLLRMRFVRCAAL